MRYLFIDIGSLCVIGALIGFFCRGRILLQLTLAFIISSLFYAFAIWRFPDPNIWSWRDPITSAVYQLPWFATVYLAPTFFVSLVIGKLRARHR